MVLAITDEKGKVLAHTPVTPQMLEALAVGVYSIGDKEDPAEYGMDEDAWDDFTALQGFFSKFAPKSAQMPLLQMPSPAIFSAPPGPSPAPPPAAAPAPKPVALEEADLAAGVQGRVENPRRVEPTPTPANHGSKPGGLNDLPADEALHWVSKEDMAHPTETAQEFLKRLTGG